MLAIDIKDKHNKIHTLKYWLYDTALSDKFINVLRKNKKNTHGFPEFGSYQGISS